MIKLLSTCVAILLLVSVTVGCPATHVGSLTPGSSGQGKTGEQEKEAEPIQESANKTASQESGELKMEPKMEIATFGGGCFWCTEAVFQELEGVASVKSGYMGGRTENPTYKQICTGTTGHAEVIQIEYDPEKVSFDVLLQVFWKTHDPTTLNRQGNDVGTQYRSAVFYHSEEQQKKASDYKKKLNDAKAFSNPIVTEITAASKFWPAEDYHQNYFDNNPSQPYCRALIPPKLEKLRQVFGDKLKK